jgi:hypothetical protein
VRFITMLFCLILALPAAAQTDKSNFAGRKAVIINNAPFIELSGFSFENQYRDRRTRLITNLSWKNTGSNPITAFEVMILRYDPFNRPIRSGGSWMITGTDSANWAPLAPGANASDGLIAFNDEPVFTSIVFVRRARLEDGTVWSFNAQEVEKRIKQSLPEIKEFLNLETAGREPATE